VGRIGKKFIQRASGFRMRVLCFDIVKDEALAEKYGVLYVDLDTLLRESDFISLHVPFTQQTSKLINSETLSKMKKTAILVNTARGGLIDEDALAQALSEGQIGACGLDVLTDEESYDKALCKLPNCIIVPHIGAATQEASFNMGLMAAKNLLEYLSTGKCDNLI
jgi:D-3-phosphoglycerate dehydrogenase